MLKINKIWLFCLIGLIVTACSISYKFNGASIDYTKVKTITIKDFPNQAPLVYPPLSQKFTEALKDIYIRQTRLQLVGSNGDLDLEGEITGYDLTPMAVKEDAYASQTKLTITVRVRYAIRMRILSRAFRHTVNSMRLRCCNRYRTSYRKRLLTSLSIKFIMQRLPTGKNESC